MQFCAISNASQIQCMHSIWIGNRNIIVCFGNQIVYQKKYCKIWLLINVIIGNELLSVDDDQNVNSHWKLL